MTLAALTILGPLAAAALALLLRPAAPALALLGTGLALIGALFTLVLVAGGARYAATLPGLPELPLRLVVEPLTAVLAVFVSVVSFFVMVYAVGYTAEEVDKRRFFAGMSFFVAAMQTLVLAGDWVLLLAAWEVIGFASYLLIGFWFWRPGVGGAATRAFLYTRTADLGLYGAIFVLIGIAPAARRRGQVGPDPPAGLAAGRHGGPHPGLGAPSFRDARGRRGDTADPDLPAASACGAPRRGRFRRRDRARRRPDRRR
jgi:NADH-quinone oxidoreductase subunit L